MHPEVAFQPPFRMLPPPPTNILRPPLPGSTVRPSTITGPTSALCRLVNSAANIVPVFTRRRRSVWERPSYVMHTEAEGVVVT